MQKTIFFLFITFFLSCSNKVLFTQKKDGSDIILNGTIEKKYLNNSKKFPWFYYGYQAYQPKDSIVQLIKAHVSDLGFMVFAGSWCGDTQKELPAFFKVAQLSNIKENQIQLIMLDRNKISWFMNPKIMGVKHIPCIIVYRKDKEIGRIIETVKVSMEEDLLNIIQP
jgi:thiol-disulfide isomerase/thioredoxin